MAMSSLIFKKNKIVDDASLKTNWINILERPSSPRFSTEEDRYSDIVMNEEGFFEANEVSYNFTKNNFTICFWVKFDSPSKEMPQIENRIILMMNDETTKLELPITLDKKWHHYAFIRKGTTINFYIDKELKGTLETNKEFNLTDKSYIYIGNNISGTLGDHFYIDGVTILNRISMSLNDEEYIDTKPIKLVNNVISTFSILSDRLSNVES